MDDSPPEPETTVALGGLLADAGDTIIVQRAELERAFGVWLKTMPNHLWKPYEKMLTIDRHRLREEDRVDPRNILAAFLAEKFEQVKWTASYVKSGAMGSPPPWRDSSR